MSNIQLMRQKRVGVSRKQRNLIAIKTAVKDGQKYIFLDLERSKGIFKIIGGKRNPKLKMVQDMSRRVITIKPKPWLKPSAIEAAKGMTKEQIKNMKFQLARQTKFK